MPTYVLESYLPRSGRRAAREVARRLRKAAERHSRRGSCVRYVHMTFLPSDETCFHVFEAVSAEAVEEVGRAAGLSTPRAVEAVIE